MLTRRRHGLDANHLLAMLVLALIASVAAATAPGQTAMVAAQTDGRLSIAEENQKPGSSNWNIRQRGSDAGLEIEGFMSAASIDVGESIDYHLSVSEPQDVTIEVYRMGFYGGAAGHLVTTIGPLPIESKAAPFVDPATGRVTTDWSADHTLTVPADWTTGVYLSRLIRADGYDGYTSFVLRDDDRPVDFLVQIPVTTYQAYNNFPDDGVTGKSLYDYNSYGPAPTGGDGAVRAIEVSFDRPYDRDGAGQYFSYDHGVVHFLEREGYNIGYTTNLDPIGATQRSTLKGFISSGHDEYWSSAMYDRVEGLRDDGIDVAFLGANAAYWRIDTAPSSLDGRPDRVIVGPKVSGVDRWREAGRPEQALVGVQYIAPLSFDFTPLVVTNADHWLWARTGLSNGDQIPDMVGYEIDTVFADVARPVGEQILLSASPFQGNIQNTSIYQAPSGALVFGSGTMNWNRGLGHPWYRSQEREAIKQATRNLLGRFAPTCLGRPATVELRLGQTPTRGDDVIIGTEGPDTISGSRGDDVICTLGGDDVVSGGSGDDIIAGGPGADRLRGGSGEDILNGGDGNDSLYGGRNRDTLAGDAGDDYLNGGGSRDSCDGGPGSDVIRRC